MLYILVKDSKVEGSPHLSTVEFYHFGIQMDMNSSGHNAPHCDRYYFVQPKNLKCHVRRIGKCRDKKPRFSPDRMLTKSHPLEQDDFSWRATNS